jgi:hypothetical protein
MDQDLLKRLLDFLSDQGAELNRWEAKRLSMGMDLTDINSWEIKDRGLIDYLVERCLNKDKSFLYFCEKAWQTALEFGPLYQPFLYSPIHPWIEWRNELSHEMRKKIVRKAASHRLNYLSPEEIYSVLCEVAKESKLWQQMLPILNDKQKEQWNNLCKGIAITTSYESLHSLKDSLGSCHIQEVPLKEKFQRIDFNKHQLDLLYRLRARQQIEILIQKFYQTSFSNPKKDSA